jgi:hypothetical protein
MIMAEAAEWLSALELFDFAPTDLVRAPVGLNTVGPPDQLINLIELNAAEMALFSSTEFIDTVVQAQHEVSLPIPVTSRELVFALFKTNCGPFFEHGSKALDEIKLWDVFLFAGDMSKFEWLTPSLAPQDLARDEGVESFVGALRDRYRAVGGALIELTELQAFLWRAKVQVLIREPLADVRWTGFRSDE